MLIRASMTILDRVSIIYYLSLPKNFSIGTKFSYFAIRIQPHETKNDFKDKFKEFIILKYKYII